MSVPFQRGLLAAVLAAPLLAAAAGGGAALYQARCAACHGAQGAGNSGLQAPPIAGQDPAYLIRQLQQFRSRARGGENPPGPAARMQAVAQSLPDDSTVAALAQYVSRLMPPAVKAAPPAAGSDAMAGKAVYSVCMGCHGSTGEGNVPLGAPRLNHLPVWYTLEQLKAYRGDQRGAQPDDKPGQQMRQVAKEALPDDEAAAQVAHYITTLGTARR